MSGEPMNVVAALKLVDLRPDIDPLTGAVRASHRQDSPTLGASAADYAALEMALRIGAAWRRDVVAVSVGPSSAEPLLRESLALGARRAVRVELPSAGPHGTASSAAVAAALAAVAGPGGSAPAELVVCGEASTDRGSGAVPAFLAGELSAAQALGLVSLEAAEPLEPLELRALRRLDGGRRERLRVPLPAVVSVETGAAAVRRAGLAALLDAETAAVETAPAPAPRDGLSGFPQRFGPFRPRPTELPAPDPAASARERALFLTGALSERTPPRVVAASPEDAADELLGYLRAHGYVRD